MNHKKNKGFTLVEVLAAITLLSVIFVGFSSAFSFQMKTSSLNSNKLTAQNMSLEELNNVLSQQTLNLSNNYSSIPTNSPANFVSCTEKTTTVNGRDYDTYIYVLDKGTSEDSKQIIVRTYYSSDSYVELSDYFVKND